VEILGENYPQMAADEYRNPPQMAADEYRNPPQMTQMTQMNTKIN
jgi:hypothetical protein